MKTVDCCRRVKTAFFVIQSWIFKLAMNFTYRHKNLFRVVLRVFFCCRLSPPNFNEPTTTGLPHEAGPHFNVC